MEKQMEENPKKKRQSPAIKVVVSPETRALLTEMANARGGNVSELTLNLISQGLLVDQRTRDQIRESVLRIAQAIAAGVEPERRVADLGRLLGSQPAAEGVTLALEAVIDALQAGRDIEIGSVLDQEGWSWKLHEDGVMITFPDDGVRYFVPEYDGAFLIVSNQRGGTRKQTWNALYNEWSTAEMEAGEILALAPYLAAIQEQRARLNTR
jgi:hypothetical protein